MKTIDETSPSMNGQSREGLTLEGLAAHVATSILLWDGARGKGTKNDCKHAIAHNVRAYQRRLIVKDQISDVRITADALKAEAAGGPIQLEHAIPIGCLMNLLFHKIGGIDFETATSAVMNIIEENTVLVWVTPAEHAVLNERYQCRMPEGFDTYPWKDKLARYTVSGISALSASTGKRPKKVKPTQNDLDVEMEEDFSPD